MPLKVSHGAGAWIHHFVHSDNPKFKGKSKEKRKKMALGAYYSAKQSGKESIDLNILYDEGERKVKPSMRLIESRVFDAIFSEDDTDASVTSGVNAYQIKIRYQAPTTDLLADMVLSIRADSPEAAKSQAMTVASEMGFTNVSIIDVAAVPDGGGSGEPVRPADLGDKPNLNPDPTALDGVVLPSAVSPSLSNAGVVLPKVG